MIHAFDVIIPLAAWEQCGATSDSQRPWTRLLATATINDYAFHLEAVAVNIMEDGSHEAVNPDFDSWLDHIIEMNGSRCQTQRIGDYDYVIGMTPHGD